MGEFSIFHWLIVLVVLIGVLVVLIGIPYLLYRLGKKVGDQQGYIRGYKEGQQSGSKQKAVDGGTF